MIASVALLVLLAEDDLVQQKLFTTALFKLGLSRENFLVFSNGSEAIEYLSQATSDSKFQMPNLVITDWQMPIVDGFGLLDWIRKNPLIENIPVILLTANFDALAGSLVQHFKFNALFPKSRNFSEIVATLEKALQLAIRND